MDKGQTCAWASQCHVLVQGVFRRIKGMGCTIMTVDAVHEPLLAHNDAGCAGRDKFCD